MGSFEIIKRNGQRISLLSREPFCAVTSAVQNISLMGDDNVQISFVSDQILDLVKGDKILVLGEEYTIRTKIAREIMSDTHFVYNATFYGVMYELMKSQYRNTDANGKSTKSTFDLTYSIKDFVKVLIYNVSRDYPGIWAFDEANCPDTEPLTIQFSRQNCLQVLQTLCSEENFNLEFRITQKNGVRTIHIGKFGSIITPPGGNSHFEWGKGLGLYSLKEDKVDDKAIITRLWVEGGATNIKSGYRDYSDRLQLPFPQRLNTREHKLADGTVVAPGTQTIGIADDANRYFEDAALRDQIGSDEDTEVYDNIYPSRTGSITALVDGDLNSFIDSSMDFDLNEKDENGETRWLVGGVTAKINFITGKLAGQQFELKAEGGYDHSQKKFTIISYTDERGLKIPTTDNEAFRLGVGDQYKITDINLPDSYIQNAEEDLWYAGLDDFNTRKQARAQYTLTLDRKYFMDAVPEGVQTAIFKVGDYVPVKDARFGIEKNIRIQKIARNLLLDQDYSLTLSDITAISISTQTVINVLKHEQIITNNHLKDLNKARKGWRTTEELRNMVYDTDGYFDTENIRPNSIDTNMLTVGSKSQQFVLTGVILEPNFVGNGNRFNATAGVLSHLTIDESAVKAWNMAAAEFNLEHNGGYYLYAKCSKQGTGGVWYLSQEQLRFETVEDPSNYYFQVGILSSLYEDGFRDFNTTYGFTRINGNTITTGKIVSSDGGCFLDLDGNKFRIGNAASSMDWNVTADGQLTLKNVKLMSGSGDISEIGVYRGVYDSKLMYYKGDEVSYTANGKTITYRYIHNTPTEGNLPTNSLYWAIVAQGADGKDGVDGTNGKDGEPGAPGEPGTDGTDGKDGVDGKDGEDGVGVSQIKNFYLLSSLSSGITTDTSGWSETLQNPTNNLPYLWNYEKVIYTNGAEANTTPCIKAIYSKDGKGISKIDEYYQVSASNAAAPTSWKKNEIPALTNTYKYLWKYEVITYTDNSTFSTIAGVVGVYGDQGEKGIPGDAGADGKTSYLHIKYSDDGGLSFTANNGEDPGAYMGQYTDFNEFDSGDPTAYTWSKCTGEPGAGGVDAAAEDYYEYRYSKDGSTTAAQTPLDPNDPNPAGWSLTMPTVGDLEYIWHTMAKKSGLTGKTDVYIPVKSGESGTLNDDSGHGHNATMGTGASVVSINSRYALNLPKNAECTIPYDLPFGENFTLCFWMRTDQTVIKWMFIGFNGRDYVENKIDVSANTWYHLAFRFNGNSVAVLLNGTWIQSGTVINTPVGFSLFDDNMFGSNAYFDDVRILKGALPQSDITRVMNGTADSLVIPWSTPTRITPVNGKNGSSPVMIFRGDYKDDTIYYGNPSRVDAVYWNGKYYIARVDAEESAGITPGTGFNSNMYPISELEMWNLFGTQFESVATKLLLAEKSYIKNLIAEEISMRDANNNVIFEAKDGDVTCNKGTFKDVDVKGNLSLSKLTYGVNEVDSNWNMLGTMIDFRTLPDYKWNQGQICYLPSLSGGCREVTFFVPRITVDDNDGNYPTIYLRGYGEINVPTEYKDCFYTYEDETHLQIKQIGIYTFIGITRDIDIEEDGTISYCYDTWYLASAMKFSGL